MNVLTNRIILSILFLVALFPKIEIFADNHYIAEAKKQNRRLSNQIIKIDEYIEGQNAQRLNLEIGKSVTVELPVDIEDLLTSDPKLISPIVRTSKEVVFIGKKIGQTNILFFLKGRSKPISLEIVIDQDMEGLRAAIRQLVPGVNLNVEVMNGNIVISGVAPNSDSVNIVNRLAETWVKNGKVVNLVTVKGNDQVQLKVRVVEMQRSLAKQLGLDLAGQFSNNNTNIKAGILNGFGVSGKPTSGGILSTAFNFTGKLFGSEYNLTPAIELRALERVGVIRTLAEPLITSVSGEKGEFLVGGEVPIPTGYDREQRQLIVTYKEFGVGLEFTPIVLNDNRISLNVSVEVSELGTNTLSSRFLNDGGSGGTAISIPSFGYKKSNNNCRNAFRKKLCHCRSNERGNTKSN